MIKNLIIFAAVCSALVVAAILSGCATKHVMKECEQINDGKLFVCKKQYEVWN